MSEAVRTILRTDGAAANEPSREADAGFFGIFGIRGAEFGDSGQPAGYGYVVGGAAGFGADCGGQGVCYAGFLSAPGDSAFLWAL